MEAVKSEISFGKKIKIFRQQHKVTRQHFSELVGCTLRTLDRWEASDSIPSPIYKSKVNSVILKIGIERSRQVSTPL